MTRSSRPEDTTVDAIQENLRGKLIEPTDPEYDEARTIWNAMIDRHPAFVVQCTGVADVITAVNFAREHDLLVAVRGGGHNVAGNAVCDDGLVIDLSAMNGVRVNPETKTVHVGGGATMGDLDHETQAFGLATTGGVVSTTGVAGLTLGGGLGRLDREFGLTVDNLLSADVVTADGELVYASEDEHPNLFWGLRGGGGNFGIVTSLEFQLHDVGPDVLVGQVIHPIEAAADVLHYYREFMADAPDYVQCSAIFSQVPALPEFPEELHRQTVLVLVPFCSNAGDEAEELLEPVRTFGDPIADTVQSQQYTTYQQSSDELFQAGHRNYWKSHFMNDLSEGAIDTIIEHVTPIPTPFTTVFFEWMGGAIRQVDSSATAFPHRDAAFSFTVAPKWTDPRRDDELISWAREFHEAMGPYAADGVYVNYLDDDEEDRVRSAYGERYERLVDLKNEWDPANLFRMNQNIEPTV